MSAAKRPAIAAWPTGPLTLPRYIRRQYRYAADRTLFVAEADDGEGVATGETVLRLAEVPLDDPGALLGFVNAVGTVGMSEDAESQTMAEFMLVVEAVRDAVTAWRVLQGDDESAGEIFWHLPRLRGVPAHELPEAAAEFLTVVLDTGLAAVRPRVSLAVNGDREPPLLDLTLYALCCCELFNHVVSGADFRVCANEACERLFVRDDTAKRRGVLYCSRTCARAQAQREFRRRKAEHKGEVATET
jgi:hypothetical protein